MMRGEHISYLETVRSDSLAGERYATEADITTRSHASLTTLGKSSRIDPYQRALERSIHEGPTDEGAACASRRIDKASSSALSAKKATVGSTT